jgi:hypothetical protein
MGKIFSWFSQNHMCHELDGYDLNGGINLKLLLQFLYWEATPSGKELG